MYKEYDSDTLKKLQTVELGIMHDFICICQKHDIDYFLFYGSAIGAARHHGFIPWDDDVDIGMLRRDYEKFLKVAPNEIAGKYKLTGPDCSNKFYNLVPNISKIGTTFSTVFDHGRYNCGILIDIYPFDFTFSDLKKRKIQSVKALYYRNLYLLKNVNFNILDEKKFNKRLLHEFCAVAHYALNILHISTDYLYKKFLKYAGMCHETDLITTFTEPFPEVSLMRMDELYPLQDLEFEGLTVKVPNKNNEILTRVYGNYMVMPPLEQRQNHPPYLLSFDNKEFIREGQ